MCNALVRRSVFATLVLLTATASTAETLEAFGKDAWKTPSSWPTLAVLVDFSPYETNPPNVSTWHDYVFNPAHSPDGVNRYFNEASMGNFQLAGAATIAIQVPYFYSPNDVIAFHSNLVHRAMASGQYNFAANDVNHDGTVTVDELLILFLLDEGGGAVREAGRVQPPGSTVAFQGRVATAHLGFDLWSFTTMCHELGHLLGATDLYGIWSTDEDINRNLSIMSTGLVYPDPWHKLRFGWNSPRIRLLETGGFADIPVAQAGLADSPVILYNEDRGPGDYFLLEYRSTNTTYGAGYDRELTDAGLVIWQIHQDSSKNLVPYCDIAYPSAENEWYECSGCRSFVPRAALSSKTCPGGGNHAPQVYYGTVANPRDMHTLDKDMTGSVWGGVWESGWRTCADCGTLFFGPNQASSHCSYGGAHDASGSENYSLRRNTAEVVGHNRWARCTQCQSLGYTSLKEGRVNSGCAANSGGAHAWGADRYVLNAHWSDLTMLTRSAPNLLYGSNGLWRAGSVTPNLTWYEGGSMPTRLYVHPFAPTDSSIRVEWLTAGDTWVDFAHSGAEQGTFDNPFNTFGEGAANVPHGGTLHIKAGSHAETGTVNKRVTIRSYGGTATIGR